MSLILIVLCAIILDSLIGEPRNSYHPLVAFGKWANWLERAFYNSEHAPKQQKFYGALAWISAVSPCALSQVSTFFTPLWQDIFELLILYFCIGARSLQQHAGAVFQALRKQQLILAQQQVAYIVSRQTDQMTIEDVQRATIESVLENGADAVFAPLFWFLILGPFGALLYRFSNTLDAMWGYKNQRYIDFGWMAARLDDVFNWVPARLTALSYSLLGNSRLAFRAWINQAYLLDSPNAGPVMTAGAGALNLKLGGPAWYHGHIKSKPWFGGNNQPTTSDIYRAIALVYQSLVLWLIMIAFGASLA